MDGLLNNWDKYPVGKYCAGAQTAIPTHIGLPPSVASPYTIFRYNPVQPKMP
jgi:hypothetical protein